MNRRNIETECKLLEYRVVGDQKIGAAVGTENAKSGSTLSMASNSAETRTEHLGLEEISERMLTMERRKHFRAQVHWPVVFTGSAAEDSVRTVTKDLSNKGFYCIANAHFSLGETVECTLIVPTRNPSERQPVLPLACKVRVVRMEKIAEGALYGFGFQIEDYRLSAQPAENLTEHPEKRLGVGTESA